MNSSERRLVGDLLLQTLEGSISEADFEQLQDKIIHDPEVQDYYFEALTVYIGLVDCEGVEEVDRGIDTRPEYFSSLLNELAEDEKVAPAVEIEKPTPEKVPVQMLKIEKPPRVINKFSLYSALISAAAALAFVIFYVNVVPPAPSTVAEIVDSVHAQWEQGESAMTPGSRLWGHKGSRWLKKGTVKIAFDYGAEVIIEGPVEFELESADEMILHSGRLFATVPEGAVGFTVKTPYSTVIDLGTEFGLEVGFDGSTDVHMFKGKASLIPGCNGEKKEGLELIAGQAKAVAKTGKVQAIKLKKQAFVRDFDSEKQFLWRGEPINLADIVGGGNGFGTGRRNYGISVDEDMVFQETLYIHGHPDYLNSGFQPISSVSGIDGTFVPDSSKGPVVISSQGHIFSECPDTSGISGAPIINGARIKKDDEFPERNGRTSQDGQLMLAGVECGTDENPSIFMHANAGITFDLKKIQMVLPEGVRASRFTTFMGVPNDHAKRSYMDVWVMVDGEVRFSKLAVRADQTFDVDIPLVGTERFLTFVVTDGGVNDPSEFKNKQGFDWFLLSRPYLELESSPAKDVL